MKVCCCTMAGTAACFSCPNNPATVFVDGFYQPKPLSVPYPHSPTKKRIVEKYENGQLVERIIEDDETIKPV